MKKILLTIALIAAVIGLVMSPVASQAAYFTLNDAALLMLWETDEDPTGGTQLVLVTDNPMPYNGGVMGGTVGFGGLIFDTTMTGGFAEIQIGANVTGTSPFGTGATVAHVIGTALGIADTSDLSAFDEFSLELFNDIDINNFEWQVNLSLATTGGSAETGWTTIGAGSSAVLTVDLTSILDSDLEHVTNIGINIGQQMDGAGDHPGLAGAFHISASPVPEPSSIFLLLLGFFGLAVVGKKKFF